MPERLASRVSLEAYAHSHAEELLLMWRESFEHGVGIADPHPMEEQRTYLEEKVVPGNAIRVAILEGRLVGFVAAAPGSISQLYVRKGFLRQGIGSQLLAWAKAQSDGSLWLHTFERNLGARAFYESNGFVPVSRGFEPFWQLADIRYEWNAAAVRPGRSAQALLREAHRADVRGIQRVRHSVRENVLTSCVIPDEEVVDYLERRGRGWVVEEGGEVVAFAIGNREDGNIWALFVDPACEGRGYGRRLHDTMVAWLFATGLKRLWLSTEPNTRAQGFYERAGWRCQGALPSGEVAFEMQSP